MGIEKLLEQYCAMREDHRPYLRGRIRMAMKITKKLLDDYKKTKREIPLLEAELIGMKRGDAGIGNSTIFDYQTGFPRPQSVVGFDWPLYERRKRNLELKKEKVAAVEKWIEAIEDGQTRCVFRMFYIGAMKWDKIAIKTGYAGNADYPRLYIRDKYLKEQKIM